VADPISGLVRRTTHPHILAAVAEFELEMIRERVCASVKNARQKGKRLGRPRAVFDRHRAVELRQQGRSVPEIARELGIGLGPW
jgi:putative DNA-invertase from lambdoid prophage Rac